VAHGAPGPTQPPAPAPSFLRYHIAAGSPSSQATAHPSAACRASVDRTASGLDRWAPGPPTPDASRAGPSVRRARGPWSRRSATTAWERAQFRGGLPGGCARGRLKGGPPSGFTAVTAFTARARRGLWSGARKREWHVRVLNRGLVPGARRRRQRRPMSAAIGEARRLSWPTIVPIERGGTSPAGPGGRRSRS
jgi:hypothetical protein